MHTQQYECRVDVHVGIELHPYLDLDLSYMAYDTPVSSVKLPSMHKPYISKSRAGNYGHLLTIWSTWSKKLQKVSLTERQALGIVAFLPRRKSTGDSWRQSTGQDDAPGQGVPPPAGESPQTCTLMLTCGIERRAVQRTR